MKHLQQLLTKLIALLAFSLPQSAYSEITMTSYWRLGEDASVGLDISSANDGEVNNFNKTDGTTILTATPSSAAGSTGAARPVATGDASATDRARRSAPADESDHRRGPRRDARDGTDAEGRGRSSQ
jgi:hypothetical protein